MSDDALFLAMESAMAGDCITIGCDPAEPSYTYRIVPAYSALIELEPGETLIAQVLGEKLENGRVTELRILTHESDGDHVGYIDAAKVVPLAENVVVLGRRR